MATGQIPDTHELTISEPISSQFEKIPVQVYYIWNPRRIVTIEELMKEKQTKNENNKKNCALKKLKNLKKSTY